MSLSDALFLDPFPGFAYYIAARGPSGRAGSGTAEDPWNGSTKETANVQVSLTNDQSTPSSSREALATTPAPLGLVDGDVVTIRNATGQDATPPLSDYWNGSFPVYGVSGNSFKYWMRRKGSVLTPGTIQPPIATGQITASKLIFQFDEIMRRLSAMPNTFMRIYIGSGTFETRGVSERTLSRPQVWMPSAGMKFLGSGVDITVLRLVYADVQDGNYYAIGSNIYGKFVDYAEVSSMTVDAYLPNQPVSPPYQGLPGKDYAAVACSAVGLQGAFCRISNVKAINWGTQCNAEAFVLAIGSGHPDFPNNVVTNPIIEDCSCVQPNENNRYTSTIIMNIGADDPPGMRHLYAHGPIFRRNFVDSIFSGRRPCFFLPISGAAPFDLSDPLKRVWLITTARPHQRATGNRIFISDINPGGSIWNDYFEIEDLAPPDPLKFKITFPLRADGQLPPSGHSLILGTYFTALAASGTGCIIEDNMVLNTTIGGPYNDTYNIKEIIVRRNRYRNVSVGPYMTNGKFSPGPRDVTLSAYDASTAQASSMNHGFVVGQVIRIRKATNAAYNNAFGWTISSVPDLNSFRFSMTNPPSGTDSTGFAVEFDVDLAALTFISGGFAQGTTTYVHTLAIGDRIKISKASPIEYNGLFEITSVTAKTFQYKLPPGASGISPFDAAFQRSWGIDNFVIEDNQIELALVSQYEYGAPIGIQLYDNNAILAPDGLPPYIYGNIVIRRNVIRLLDGLSDPIYGGSGISIAGAKRVLVCDNIVNVPIGPVISDYRCGDVKYLNNRTASGLLLQGTNAITLDKRTDLEVDIEDAALIAI